MISSSLAMSILPKGVSKPKQFLSFRILFVDRTDIPALVNLAQSCLAGLESCFVADFPGVFIDPLKQTLVNFQILRGRKK